MSPTQYRSRRPGRATAFTTAELVIGLAISSIVATSTVWSLVNLTRSNSSSKQDLGHKETVDRVIDLLQDEARNATRIEVASVSSPLTALPGCSTLPQLILRGEASSEDISYAMASTSPKSSDWRGPNVLLRCGLPYGADDNLDLSGTRGEQVVLDALPLGDSFVPTACTSNCSSSLAASGVNRTLQISLNSGSGSSDRNVWQVPISTNMAYDLAAQATSGATCTTSALDGVGCEDGVRGSRLFRRGLGSDPVSGLPGTEDIVHFQGVLKSNIRLSGLGGSGSCNSQYCEVSSRADPTLVTKLSDVDVLIFRDDEIRL